MKRILPIILLILISITLLNGQKTFENKKFGFSIQEPSNWIVTTNKELISNLEKFEFSEDGLARLLAVEKGSVVLTAFSKYDAKEKVGLIPTIQIRVRTGHARNFQAFKAAIIKSMENSKMLFENFEYVEEPKEVEISGIKSVLLITRFTARSKNGAELKAKSRIYAIPYKNYFFQLNFNDGQNSEDCTKLFDELVKTIKIGS